MKDKHYPNQAEIDEAMEGLEELLDEGYLCEPKGACILVKRPHGGLRYITVKGLLDAISPITYVKEGFVTGRI